MIETFFYSILALPWIGGGVMYAGWWCTRRYRVDPDRHGQDVPGLIAIGFIWAAGVLFFIKMIAG